MRHLLKHDRAREFIESNPEFRNRENVRRLDLPELTEQVRRAFIGRELARGYVFPQWEVMEIDKGERNRFGIVYHVGVGTSDVKAILFVVSIDIHEMRIEGKITGRQQTIDKVKINLEPGTPTIELTGDEVMGHSKTGSIKWKFGTPVVAGIVLYDTTRDSRIYAVSFEIPNPPPIHPIELILPG
ncbi:hypothetical protein HZC07_06240 [Candidatus Micrarchaeota archaeon]|nr:hypothetical protein [Candidatus Micrarchaeota archaeon]